MKSCLELSQIREMRNELKTKFENSEVHIDNLTNCESPVEASIRLREVAQQNRAIAEELRVFSRVLSLESEGRQKRSAA